MIDRRGFVRMVLSAAAVSPLIDVDQLLWVPGAKTWFLPTPRPSLDTLRGQTEAMVTEIARRLRWHQHKVTLAPWSDYHALVGRRLGCVIVGETEYVSLSNQYNVCIDADGQKRGAELIDWTIRPAARAIADSMVRAGDTVTATLEKPILHTDGDNSIRYDVRTDQTMPGPPDNRYDEVVVVTDPVSGIAIRGVHAYGPYQTLRTGRDAPCWVTWFDVLAGKRDAILTATS